MKDIVIVVVLAAVVVVAFVPGSLSEDTFPIMPKVLYQN